MFSHPFGADRQGGVCVVVTDGEPCGLTHDQHEKIQKAADWRARELLVALRRRAGSDMRDSWPWYVLTVIAAFTLTALFLQIS